jgi:hypothetical protein
MNVNFARRLLIGFAVSAVTACGGKAIGELRDSPDATLPDDAGPPVSPDTGPQPSATCVERGGVCIAVVPNAKCPAGFTPAVPVTCGGIGSSCCLPDSTSICRDGQDQDCNENPTSSGIAGRCVAGKCICTGQAIVGPSGKCSLPTTPPPPPRTLCEQIGGTCTNQDCGKIGAFATRPAASSSCGAATTCCISEKLCDVETFSCLYPNRCERPICNPEQPQGQRLSCAAGVLQKVPRCPPGM